MIYPVDYESKIGFDRIRGQVGEKCTTARGRELLDGETFSSSPAEIESRLALCDEVRTALMLESGFPGQEYTDIAHIARKIEVEGTFLDVEDIIALRDGLVAVGGIVDFFSSKDDGAYPAVRSMSRLLRIGEIPTAGRSGTGAFHSRITVRRCTAMCRSSDSSHSLRWPRCVSSQHLRTGIYFPA